VRIPLAIAFPFASNGCGSLLAAAAASDLLDGQLAGASAARRSAA
jgi:hypothetical protein